jgi:hypothetical protein
MPAWWWMQESAAYLKGALRGMLMGAIITGGIYLRVGD